MRLQLMSWPEVEAYLEDSNGVIVPIGSTEQHGPTGVIGTDAICAETLAWRTGELADAIVGPTLTVGMSEHHMRFPGSVTLRPTTLVAVVRDVILSLARHGFRRFFFVNGHGGNTASINAAFFEAYAEAPQLLENGDDMRCINGEWWATPSAQDLSEELFGDKDGDHASASEVSIASAAYPDFAARIFLRCRAHQKLCGRCALQDEVPLPSGMPHPWPFGSRADFSGNVMPQVASCALQCQTGPLH